MDEGMSTEVMLPGFRFHPTDEELVEFYLKRKIQQRPLSIELIKQVEIYKYDPWDLPKLATSGEKEWYFFCKRDRKYRNSSRPNRVTGAGFWKATGTDRPIYSSEGCSSKCIGLKKSLVFYKGRAAKGIKTDWMMHEFRLPSVMDSVPPKRFIHKIIPSSDSWAICRIFKKPNPTTQRRALSHSWVSPLLPQTTKSEILTQHPHTTDKITLTTKTSSAIQFGSTNDFQHSYNPSFSPICDVPPYIPVAKMTTASISRVDLPTSYAFSSPETSDQIKGPGEDASSSSMLKMTSSIFGDFGKTFESIDYSWLQENFDHGEEKELTNDADTTHFVDQWETMRSIGCPFGLPSSIPDAWKSNSLWDSSSPCPTQMSTTQSTNKGYTLEFTGD